MSRPLAYRHVSFIDLTSILNIFLCHVHNTFLLVLLSSFFFFFSIIIDALSATKKQNTDDACVTGVARDSFETNFVTWLGAAVGGYGLYFSTRVGGRWKPDNCSLADAIV